MAYLIRDDKNGNLLDIQDTPELAHAAAKELEKEGHRIIIEHDE